MDALSSKGSLRQAELTAPPENDVPGRRGVLASYEAGVAIPDVATSGAAVPGVTTRR